MFKDDAVVLMHKMAEEMDRYTQRAEIQSIKIALSRRRIWDRETDTYVVKPVATATITLIDRLQVEV